MDQEKAKQLAREGFEFFRHDRLHDAEQKFLRALKHLDPRQESSRDIYADFALVLKTLDKMPEAAEQYEAALSVTLQHNSSSSTLVSLARYSLAECKLEMGLYAEALDVLQPAILQDCENRWQICFLAARICHRMGDQACSDNFASQVMFLAPKNKFSGIADLKKLIRED